MHWVYLLQLEDDRIYIGETTRLIRRLAEHTMDHKSGSISTDEFQVERLLGLYKVDDNIDYYLDTKDSDFNHLDIENIITENTMSIYNDKWWKVRGGKYTKILYDKQQECECKDYYNCSECHFNKFKKDEMIKLGLIKENKLNAKTPNLEKIMKRPKCDCNIPCEIKLSKNDNYYWVCSMKENSWIYDYLYFDLDVNNGCKFYTTDLFFD